MNVKCLVLQHVEQTHTFCLVHNAAHRKNAGERGVLSSAPGETRTHTGRVLNPLPLPIGLLGRTGRDVSASSHKRGNPRLYPHACLARPAQRTRSASPGPHHGRVGVFE